MTYVFLHGLGQTPAAWQPVLRRLAPENTAVFCPDLAALVPGPAPDYPSLLAALEEQLAPLPSPLHLCGLSLGGILALDYALRRQEQVASAVLCAVPVRMPRTLLRIQDLLFGLMPERAFAGTGFSRQRMRSLARSMAALDFSPRLPELHRPVLVLCGSRDRANRRSARELARALPDARLHWLAGADHELNTEAPEITAELLRGFYQSLA